MKKLQLLFVLIILSSFAFSNADAQVSVTGAVFGNGNHATLSAAFNAINSNPQIAAFINITINANTTEPVTGAVLFEGAWNALFIQPSGGLRTISGIINPGRPLIELNGADRVTINGFNSLILSNTTISSNPNTSTIRFISDAVNNTITGCTILGSSTTTLGTSGGTILFSGGLTTGNDNNVISFCDIGPGSGLPTNAVNFAGTSSFSNSSNTIINCNIFNYFNATASSAGVFIGGGSTDITIRDNKFYQTASRTQTTGSLHSAILIDNTSGNNYLVSGNIIGFASPSGTGTYTFTGTTNTIFDAIVLNVGTTTATSVQGNTIAGIAMSGSQSGNFTLGPFKGINVLNGLVNLGTVTANTIGSLSSSGSITYTSSSASASAVIGISIGGTANITASNNNIGGITASNTASGPANIWGIRSTTTGILTCQNNTIGGTVANSIQSTSTSTSTIVNGIENSGGTSTISANTIRNLTSASGTAAGGYAAPIAGIMVNVLNFNQTISQNIIQTINNTDNSNATVTAGIYLNTTSTTNLVERNFVHSFTANSSNGSIMGLYANGGTVTYRNNMVRLGINGSGGSVASCLIRGINETGGTNNFYFNSVYIGGSAASGSSNTFAFNSTVTSNTRRYVDNIFFNARSNSGGTGKHYAISAGGTTPLPSGLFSNYNILHVAGSGSVLGLFNSTDQPNLTTWKTATGKDTNSISADPTFTNPTGNSSAVNLHIGGMTPVESAGTLISSVTNDFDGQTRSILTPTDIGADGGNFTGLQGPIISYTLLPPAGLNTVNFNNLIITDTNGVNGTSGTRPRCYYKKKTNINTFNDNTNSTNGWKYAEAAGSVSPFNFTIDNSLIFGGVAVGDTIQYFVVAQDLFSLPSVGINTGTFASIPSSVNLTASAFPINGSINFYAIIDVIPPSISYTLLPDTGLNMVNFNNVVITDPSGVNGTAGTRPRCYYKKKTNSNTFNNNTSSTNGWKYVEAAGAVSTFNFLINNSLIFGGVATGDSIQYFVVAQDLSSPPNVAINSGTFASTPTNVNLTASAFPISGSINSYAIRDVYSPIISYTLLSTASLNALNFNNVIITDTSGVNVISGTKPRCYYKKKTNTNTFNDNTNSTNGWKYVEAAGSVSSFNFTIDNSLMFGGVASGDSIQYFVAAQDLISPPNVGINSGTFASTPSSVNLTASAFPINGSINFYTIGTVTVSGALTGNGWYPTLAYAFSAINSGAQTGANINILITDNLIEPITGAVLNSGAWSKITIQPAGSRTISAAVNPGSALIDLNGADNVTIDGLNSGGNSLTLSNTTVSSTQGTSTVRFPSDANHNIVTRCSILGSSSSRSTCANVYFGTGNFPGNDYNVISYCDIGPAGTNLPASGVTSIGSGWHNTGDTIRNCNFYDYFHATDASAGIYLSSNNSDFVIKDNKFYQTSPRAQSSGASHAAILIENSGNFQITGNTIGFSSSSGTGIYNFSGVSGSTLYGIFVSVGSTIPTSVQGNTIAGISMSGDMSLNCFRGIHSPSGSVEIGNITGNVIGSMTSTGSISYNTNTTLTSSIYAISGSTTNWVVNNNSIGGIIASNINPAGACAIYGIRHIGVVGSLTCNNNIIGGSISNSIQSTTTADNNLTVVQGIVTQAQSSTITGNVIRNLSAAGGRGSSETTPVLGVLCFNNGSHTVSQNTIYGLSYTHATSPGSVTGIDSYSPGPNVFSKNIIHSLSSASTAATISGIVCGWFRNTVQNNMIRLGLDTSGNSMSTGCNLNGIYVEPLGENNFYFNSVYIGGTVASGSASSYAFSSSSPNGSLNIQNNIFYNARTNNSESIKHTSINIAGSNLTCDYNILFAPNSGGMIGFYNNTNYANLADWRAATGQDNNSLVKDPQFINTTGGASSFNLHVNNSSTPVEQKGISIGSVTDDFDGELRSSLTPSDIGADAGNFTQALTPLAGDYTVGLSMFNLIAGTNIYFEKTVNKVLKEVEENTDNATEGNMRDKSVKMVMREVEEEVFVPMQNGKVYNGPLFVKRTNNPGIPADAMAGVYATINAALNDLYSSGASAPVRFLLTDADYTNETLPIRISQWPGASVVNTLTIKPNTGVTSAISGNSFITIFDINAVDHFILDGSNTNSGTSKDLTITNTFTIGSTIRFIDDARNNAVKNCILRGSTISSSDGVVFFSTTNGTSGNDSNLIQNNDITKSSGSPNFCVYNNGTGTTSATKNSGNRIIGNRVFDFQLRGIGDEGNSAGILYEGNEIYSVSVMPGFLVGFRVAASNIEGFTFRNNFIHDLKTSATTLVYGIELSQIQNSFTGEVYNNFISLSEPNSNDMKGIVDNSPNTNSYNIYFNSINITGSVTGAKNSEAYYRVNATNSNFKNNIAVNTRNGGTGKHYAISAVSPLTNFSCNYNDIYAGGGAGNVFGRLDATDKIYLVDWQTATEKDSNSVSGNPRFISETNLHIDSTVKTPVEQRGISIVTITNDIDGELRSTLTPADIGADAGNFIQATPLAGDYTVGLSMFNSIAGTNIYFEKTTRKVLKEFEETVNTIGNNANDKSEVKRIIKEFEEEIFVPMQNGKVYTGPLFVKRSSNPGTPTDAMAGVYATINAALNDLYSSGASAPVRFLLTDADYTNETLPITINQWPGASVVNTLTIKPNTGVTSTISGNSFITIFDIITGDHFILDGSNSNNGITKDLTVANSSTGGSTIRFINDARSNTVKNCVLKGNTNAFSNGVIFFSTTTGTSGNDSNLIQNNDITKNSAFPNYGVYNNGTGTSSATKNSNNRIIGNRVFDFQSRGLNDDGNSAAILYEGNEIYSVSVMPGFLVGFRVGAANIEGFTFRNNFIHDLKTSATTLVYGIELSQIQNSFTGEVYNNFISLSEPNSNDMKGIVDNSPNTNSYNIYFNSINITGLVTGARNSEAYYRVNATNTNFKNNIVVNTRNTASGGTGIHCPIRTVTPLTNFNSNYNDIYVEFGLGGGNVFARLDATYKINLADWQSSTGKDSNSVSGNPLFVSATHLHIDSASNSPVNSAGTPVEGITNDFDYNTRNLTTPDIGADEYNYYAGSIALNLTMFIEGFYNAGSNSQVSDTIKVYLRNLNSPYGIVDSSKAVVLANGTAALTFSNASTGTYYVVLGHRNSIETWSSSGILLTQGSSVSYNFSNAASQAFGNNIKQVDASPLRFATFSGDVNQDGIVDAGDLSLVDNDAFNSVSGYVRTDVNGDDFVDASDLSIVDNNAFNGVIVRNPIVGDVALNVKRQTSNVKR